MTIFITRITYTIGEDSMKETLTCEQRHRSKRRDQ